MATRECLIAGGWGLDNAKTERYKDLETKKGKD